MDITIWILFVIVIFLCGLSVGIGINIEKIKEYNRNQHSGIY